LPSGTPRSGFCLTDSMIIVLAVGSFLPDDANRNDNDREKT